MMSDALFPYLPRKKILHALKQSPGNEVASGKLDSPESSAALAVNTFGYFLERPADLPTLPGLERHGWPAIRVSVEQCVRFPWRGGHHPWLDAFVETETHIIGIESKRYEPFRSKSKVRFSDAYWRDVWGEDMKAFENMRDGLVNGQDTFERLDATQLVKHAFGLRTESQRRTKAAVLLYLYAEPECWPSGKPVDQATQTIHAAEIGRFTRSVAEDEVEFYACSYRALLARWKESSVREVRDHGARVLQVFRPCRDVSEAPR